jgi:hypothetical protein
MALTPTPDIEAAASVASFLAFNPTVSSCDAQIVSTAQSEKPFLGSRFLVFPLSAACRSSSIYRHHGSSCPHRVCIGWWQMTHTLFNTSCKEHKTWASTCSANNRPTCPMQLKLTLALEVDTRRQASTSGLSLRRMATPLSQRRCLIRFTMTSSRSEVSRRRIYAGSRVASKIGYLSEMALQA